MNILWLTWKDKKHPQAGGAETVNEELAKRLAKDGHEVLFLVGGFAGGAEREERDGFKVVRLGNRWTVYWQAYRYYKKHFSLPLPDGEAGREWEPGLVIDEVNTIPFFAKFYAKEKNILFIHQLCRRIWFYEMFFPLNLIGYLIEPFYLRLLSDRKVITVSESTGNDLLRFGFKGENISIISEGIEIEPVGEVHKVHKVHKVCKDGECLKFEGPTVLSLGAIRSMKRTHHILKAFESAKERVPDLQLIVAGSAEGRYGRKVLKMIESSRFRDSMVYLGKVSKEKKIELMRRSHLICVASVKEGWGLIVTEAASQGTPALVYDVDGLRDSVEKGEAGFICEPNPFDLAKEMVYVFENPNVYENIRRDAWERSKAVTFDIGYEKFKKIVSL